MHKCMCMSISSKINFNADNKFITSRIIIIVLLYPVIPPPQPAIHPINETIDLLKDATNYTLTCTTDGATSYKWEKYPYGYVPLNITTTTRRLNEITLVNLQPYYEGSYRCLAINGSGSSYSDFTTITIEGLRNIIISYRLCKHIQNNTQCTHLIITTSNPILISIPYYIELAMCIPYSRFISLGANFPEWSVLSFSRNFPDLEIHYPNNRKLT